MKTLDERNGCYVPLRSVPKTRQHPAGPVQSRQDRVTQIKGKCSSFLSGGHRAIALILPASLFYWRFRVSTQKAKK